MATQWTYGADGLNQNGLTKEQQDYWDQQGVKQQNDLGYTWQPTYNKGYGGFQTQAEYDAWKATQPAAPPRVDWQAEAAAGRPVIGGVSASKDPYAGVPAPQPAPAATGGQPVPFGGGGSPGSVPGSSTAIPSAPQPGTAGGLYGMGLQGLGMGLQPFQAPYLEGVSQSLWNQANRNWADNINPAIQNASVMSGNFGDRSEIASGVMMDLLNQSVFNAMAPQYAQSYDNWLNRGVQAGNAALGSDLGYGNLGLGYYGADTQRQLGMGALDVSRYNAQTNAATAAAGAGGTPQYTNPWLAGIGALTSLYPFLFPKS